MRGENKASRYRRVSERLEVGKRRGASRRKEAGKCRKAGGGKRADKRKRSYSHLLQISILVQTVHFFMTWYALSMPNNRRTTTSIENGASKKIGVPSQDKRTTTKIENRADEKTGASAQVEIINIQSQKIDASLQVETANISGFSILRIVSLECILSDNLKTYIHWQITTFSHYHRYWEPMELKEKNDTKRQVHHHKLK